MADASRTITIKFTASTKNLVSEVAKANAALDTVGKQSNEIKRVSESMSSFSTTVKETTNQTSKLRSFKDAFSSLADGVQPLGDAGLRVSALTAGIVRLSQAGRSLAPLIGVLGLVPGAVAVAGGAFAVLKLGSDGIAAAFKGVGDSAKRQVSAVFQNELAPAVQATNHLLTSLTPSLKDVAWEMAHMANATLETASNANNLKSMNTILAATKQVVGNIGGALGVVISAFLTVASVAAPMFADLTNGAIQWAVKLQEKVQEVAQNGKLRQWIQDGIDRIAALKNGVIRFWHDIEPVLKGLAGQRLTLFGNAEGAISPALKAVGDFLTAHPDFAQWVVAAGLALKGLSVAIGILNAAMDLNPIVLILGAVSALALGLVSLYQSNAGFKQWVDSTWKTIQDVTGAFINWWQQNAAPVLAKGWELVVAAAQGAYEMFRDHIIPGLQKLWEEISPILQQAWQNLVDAWNEIRPTLKQIYDWIKDHWSEIKQAAKDYGEAVGAVVGAVLIVIGILATAFALMVEWISAQVKVGIQIFLDLKQAVNDFLDFFTRMTFNVGQSANNLGSGIRRFLTDPWGAIQDAARGAMNWIQQQWNGLPGWFKDLGARMAAPFVGAFQAVVAGIRGIINQAIDLANSGIDKVNGATAAVGIPPIGHIPHLRVGGPVLAGQPYIVGDGGTGANSELFVPSQPGRIYSHRETQQILGSADVSGDVVLEIDGEVFARIAKREILNSNRRTRAAVMAGSTR
jgi:hypothetical protein